MVNNNKKTYGPTSSNSFSSTNTIAGMRLSSIICILTTFSMVNFFYFYSQIQLEHTQVSLVIQSFEQDLTKLQDRQKRSLAHITERFNELRTQVIDMEMEYDAMNDKIKQVKDVAERRGDETRNRVKEISKKVSGIGVLLGRMPSLLQKVEAENRDSVETVNSKLNKLETLLGNPSLRNYLKSPTEKNALQSPNVIKLGDSLNPFAGSNSIGSNDNADFGNQNNKKSEDGGESPSDLPQKPHVASDAVGSGNTKDIINAHNGQLPGSLSMQSSSSNGNTHGTTAKNSAVHPNAPGVAVAGKLDANPGNGVDQHGECELDLEWTKGPSTLDTYENYMAVGEHWLEKEDFSKAIACFNYAEKMKVDGSGEENNDKGVDYKKSATIADLTLGKLKEKKKSNILRMIAAKGSTNDKQLDPSNNKNKAKIISTDSNENDNSNADMPQAVHNPDPDADTGDDEINLGSRFAGTNDVKNNVQRKPN